MHHRNFFNRTRCIASKSANGLGVFHARVDYRLRGVGRYAQDTVPIRACFLNDPKGLRTLGTVSPLVTVWNSSKKANKYSESARHG